MAENDTTPAPAGAGTSTPAPPSTSAQDDSGPLFTPSERQYFDSRGEKPIPETPEPRPEPQAESAPEQPAERPRVEISALHEERSRRREAEERARQAETANAVMQDRWRMWQQQQSAQQRPPPPPPPSPDEDIFGHARHLSEQVQQIRGEMNQYKQQEYAKQQLAALGE